MEEAKITKKTLREGATSFVKEDTPLTYEEKVALSAKTGYSISSIDQILRGSVPVLPRHQQLIELYKNILHLKELHKENYKKELKELVLENENVDEGQVQQLQNSNQVTDTEIEKVLIKLRETKVSLNKISKATQISNSTLKNYVDGKTKPTTAKLLALKAYFSEENGSSSQNEGNIDNRQYRKDNPDVLNATIEMLEERIKEKDVQIKEKDAQIKDLHEIIKQLSQK